MPEPTGTAFQQELCVPPWTHALLRFHWATERPRLQRDILAGTYAFAPVRICQTGHGQVTLWGARDALVLKVMVLVLGPGLALALSTDIRPAAAG